ncbi:MAG: GNAT family N-acetyltransferase [Ruminobacter sp.]|nr:GNAT family N-acetyltransferase [Ruminobacter sp.]
MSILIRNAQFEDLDGIAKVQHFSQAKIEYAEMSDSVVKSCLLSIEQLRQLWFFRLTDEDFMTIVAYDDSNKVVCGVITFNVFKGCAYIRSLYIEPFYIRKGIGSSLLQSCIEACRENDESKMIRLEVLEKNIPARSLYETFSFKYKNFKFPLELGGTAQRLFSNDIKVLQMELRL